MIARGRPLIAFPRFGKRLGLTANSGNRDRRPTLAELDRLMSFFAERTQRCPDSVPMHVLIAFAIFSTRRQDEICRITRKDLDARYSRVWVRDMKHPGEKIGNGAGAGYHHGAGLEG